MEASHPSALPLGETLARIFYIGGWVSPGATMDITRKSKLYCPFRESKEIKRISKSDWPPMTKRSYKRFVKFDELGQKLK
jgi:hypothetical protein